MVKISQCDLLFLNQTTQRRRLELLLTLLKGESTQQKKFTLLLNHVTIFPPLMLEIIVFHTNSSIKRKKESYATLSRKCS